MSLHVVLRFVCIFVCFLASFLTQCRPLSVSMGNAIKFLKFQITHTPPEMAEDEVSKDLTHSLRHSAYPCQPC